MLGAVAATTAVAVPTVVLGQQKAARATVEGQVGRISYFLAGAVWTANADGSDQRALGVGTMHTSSGNWTPDGSRFVYSGAEGPWSVRSDGTDNYQLLPFSQAGAAINPVYAYGGRYVIYGSYGKLSIVSATGNWQYGEQLFSVPDDGKIDGSPAVASDGTIVYQHQPSNENDVGADIYRVDSFTSVTKIIDDGSAPDFSPDSTKLAFVRSDASGSQIWIADADGGNQVQLTTPENSGSRNNCEPKWSPDGEFILFSSDAGTYLVKIKRIHVETKDVVTIIQSGRMPAWQPISPNYVERVWGQTALDTAVATSRYNWADRNVEDGVRAQAQAVVLSRDDVYLDALGGSALAVVKQGPLLITSRTGLHASTKAEMQRILGDSGTVYLLGGTVALSAAVENQVKALGFSTVRLAGATEYDTAIAIAKEIEPNPSAVILATSLKYYDALAAGAAAGANPGTVIVLTNGDTMPAATAAYLNSLDPDPDNGAMMIGVGGPGVRALINAHNGNQMPSWPQIIDYWPVFGATEYETAIEVAEFFFNGPRTAAVATATTWFDALTGGSMVGSNYGPLLLSAPGTLSPQTRAYFSRNSGTLKYATLLGGVLALKDALIDPLGNAISVPGAFKYVQYTETYTVPTVKGKALTAGDAQQHGLAAAKKTKSPVPGTKARKPSRSGN
jgi:hypothetical protein